MNHTSDRILLPMRFDAQRMHEDFRRLESADWRRHFLKLLVGQIANLRRRTRLIKNMQVLAVSSFVFCVLSMLRELLISTRALELERSDME